ncbi:(d)CMP kinase [Salinisphaera sp.]|uniref:(d)CMP kinase n=1 Tax=Salinisphaera sp. TaxID=1914330 RepID=UPI002D768164|nr:(d)CMP kinase [Salinisphaera sp.]HET7315071.1 (d)CMP kinase [Salinisphaera sp.]
MSARAPVITLDGPGGAGKGTLASELARALGWWLLDSGALYRLVGLGALREGLDVGREADRASAVAIAEGLSMRFVPDTGEGQRVELAGEDVTEAIRADAVSEAASRWAALPSIREALLARQRDFVAPPGLIADGRDMGTVIFPRAELKLYITASAAERARRRHAQLSEKGVDANLDRIYREIMARDQRDASRGAAPLKPAVDAYVIDTTGDNVATSLSRIQALVAARGWPAD